MAQVISESEFSAKVLKADKPVLVDFFATWCGPCKALAPVIDDLAEEVGDRAYVYKIDVDEAPGIVKELRIMSVPSIYAFKDGQVQDFAVGVQPKEHLLGMLFGE